MSKMILVVEDDPNSSMFVQYTLEQEGYQVVSVKNGLDGLKKAEDEHPDLIILDVMLPGLDGYEVCSRLRLKPETTNLPILMFSAKTRQDDKDAGLRVGANDYLGKPADPSEIRAKVAAVLGNASKIVYGQS